MASDTFTLIRPRIWDGKIVHDEYSKHKSFESAIRAGRRASKECKQVGIASVFYIKRGWATWALSGDPITDMAFSVLDAVRYERAQLEKRR